ncbi:MAG: NAD(P)-dependent oxidoreductase [Haliscomenobacter sp.]
MKIGILREGKIPPDSRVPLTPAQCRNLCDSTPSLCIVIQPSAGRCYTDQEYLDAGIVWQEDLCDCDFIMGVKEVPIQLLIPDKTFLFFSHTIKRQAYNRSLLQAILARRIRLIDYETLTDERGNRLIAFGRFAGMVGAHNALYTYGERSGAFHLPRMKDCHDYAEACAIYQQIQWPPIKIVLTGTGRVGSGAAEVLRDMGIRETDPEQFLHASFDEAVFTQLHTSDYVRHQHGVPFDKNHFHAHPEAYLPAFAPFAQKADIFINGIYWDKRAPVFFSPEEMADPSFHIQVIADITCDIAPDSSIPSTIRPSTIDDPVYGFDPRTWEECPAYQPNAIDVMAIDNLPNELPRDASAAFGQMFIEHVLPELFSPESAVLERAIIAEKGVLTPRFQYLQEFVNETEPV